MEFYSEKKIEFTETNINGKGVKLEIENTIKIEIKK